MKKPVLNLLIITLALAFFVFSPSMHASCEQGCSGVDDSNTFLGDNALFDFTAGDNDTAVGYSALASDLNGINNTAVGAYALDSDTSGYSNTGIGVNALSSATTGSWNTAVGDGALQANYGGNNNTALGYQAAYWASGVNNTAAGYQALYSNHTGNNNTGVGHSALYNNTGTNNIAIGDSAGINLTTGSNNIDIGGKGVAGESNTTRLGKKGTQTTVYVTGISGATVARGVGVIVDTDGHLGTTTSSARFKENIRPMNKESEELLFLQPVTFRYKHDLDPDGIPQFGLVAEQVEKIDPNLVARDDEGKPYGVRYEAVNAMLLNEFLKEHRKVEEQGAMMARQQKQIEALTALVKQQSALIQNVSAQLESKFAPRVALNE